MLEEEILRTVRRIVRDFTPLLPGVRLEAVSGEAFRARLRGRPILPGELGWDAGAAGALRAAPRGAEARSVQPRSESPETGALAENEEREEKPPYPIHAFSTSRVIVVDVEGIRSIIGGEDPRLQRVITEGMILREVIYLAASRQPLPDPRGRAETILRRHWPFQYAALRGAGLLQEAPLKPRGLEELAGEN